MNRERLYKEGTRYFFMLLGSLCYGLSLNWFLVPNNIVGGGVVGLSTLISIKTGLGTGTLSIMLNMPILLLGLKTQGWRFIVRCFITNLCIGVATDALAFLPPLTDNLILASAYGGLLQGIAIGFFIRYLVCSGGTELLARVLQRKIRGVGIPGILAALDGVIVLVGAIALKNPENVLHALILIFISAKVSDTIVTGLSRAKLCYIITDHPAEVAELLLQNSPRGVTNISGTGMYTKTPHGVLMTCVKSRQLAQLKELVKAADESAFVIVSETTEVRGKGFASITEEG